MIRDLAEDQWTAVAEGHLTGPDGRTYRRRTTRSSRRAADMLIHGGTPLVCYWFGGSQLDWHDGPDAHATWSRLRVDVTRVEPNPQRRGQPQWHAGRWETTGGDVIVLLTGSC